MAREHSQRLDDLTSLIGLYTSCCPSAREIAEQAMSLFLSTEAFQERLAERMKLPREHVIVAGPVDGRLVMLRVDDRRWIALHCDGRPLGELEARHGLTGLTADQPNCPLSRCRPVPELLRRLTHPKVHLVALHRQEIFPLPRFALSIAVLATTLRRDYVGQVSLDDMQLRPSLEDMVADIQRRQPDIIGISATFLQHRLLDELLSLLQPGKAGYPQVLLGGSLPALIVNQLLAKWPTVWVCTGPGERTVRDVVSWSMGELPKESIAGLAYLDGRTQRRNPIPSNRSLAVFAPELDLLDSTLSCGGVLNLESSRGCTNACSFCPRHHKGVWRAADITAFDSILDEVSVLFDKHSQTARKVFLVDEEFIGRLDDGSELARTVHLTQKLFKRGFHWEASTRIDQVVRRQEDRTWHCERIRFWRQLREQGLDRCLFGLESGVDTVLARFNKQTTGQQNLEAVRILSACGVPIRCSYIMFDHLMTFEELVASYTYVGRRDALIVAQPNLGPEAIWEAIHNPAFISANSLNKPLYTTIPYMLVTLELFVGCPYLAQQIGHECATESSVHLSLGKVEASFRDSHIAFISTWAQRWIDKHFSFDYTLKSLQKVTSAATRRNLGELRLLIKQAAHTWLGNMLVASTGDTALLENAGDCRVTLAGPLRRDQSLDSSAAAEATAALSDGLCNELRQKIGTVLPATLQALESEQATTLRREYDRWTERSGWELLNVSS